VVGLLMVPDAAKQRPDPIQDLKVWSCIRVHFGSKNTWAKIRVRPIFFSRLLGCIVVALVLTTVRMILLSTTPSLVPYKDEKDGVGGKKPSSARAQKTDAAMTHARMTLRRERIHSTIDMRGRII
jgi:hypothetical protein